MNQVETEEGPLDFPDLIFCFPKATAYVLLVPRCVRISIDSCYGPIDYKLTFGGEEKVNREQFEGYEATKFSVPLTSEPITVVSP